MDDAFAIVESRKHLVDAQKMLDIMPQKAYGPRIELTLQNPTLEDLILAHLELAQFCSATVQFFNIAKALHQCGQIPLEVLRYSPLQTVLTSTFCLFPKFMTNSLGDLFYLLLDRALQSMFLHIQILIYMYKITNTVTRSTTGWSGLQQPLDKACILTSRPTNIHLDWISPIFDASITFQPLQAARELAHFWSFLH